MNGKVLISGLLAFCVVFGAALIYFQNYAFYEPVEIAVPIDPVIAVDPVTEDVTVVTEEPVAEVEPDVEVASVATSEWTATVVIDDSAAIATTEMRLTTIFDGETEVLDVTDFTGINASTSPIKFRGCFKTNASYGFLTESYVIADNATPLTAPNWFDCFDAGQLTDDLASGEAIAFVGQLNISDGVDRMVAIYADGRAYAWHQLNEKYSE